MMIEATKLLGLPVAALDMQSKVGMLTQIIVDPQNGHLLGFLVTTGGILSSKKALSITDVSEWDPNGLVTGSIDNLVAADEIIRINEILKKRINLIGMGAKTESGKRLGAVEDLLIDTETECVVKYYLKDLVGKSRILTHDKVIKIEREIIFADDTTEIPTSAAGVTV